MAEEKKYTGTVSTRMSGKTFLEIDSNPLAKLRLHQSMAKELIGTMSLEDLKNLFEFRNFPEEYKEISDCYDAHIFGCNTRLLNKDYFHFRNED